MVAVPGQETGPNDGYRECTGLGSGARFVLGGNENLQRTEEIVLLSDVDWMIPTLHTTPWPIRYIPNKVYKSNKNMILALAGQFKQFVD